MDWTEITICVPAEEVERAGDIAQMVVPYGIYIEEDVYKRQIFT